MITTQKNVKIPYPTEGIIRTAQIDDTVSPTNSAQLAVNMNFDRIAAAQTRLGVTQHAGDITGPIKNYGTLNNSKIIDGFSKISKMSIEEQIGGNIIAGSLTASQIDNTHYILFYSTGTTPLAGVVQVMEVDNTTGIITMKGGSLTYDNNTAFYNSCQKIDSTHFVNVWQGRATQNLFAQSFVVNTTLWTVTSAGSVYNFLGPFVFDISTVLIDANHILILWATGVAGYAQVIEVNLSTWAITLPAVPPFAFETTGPGTSCVGSKIDASHAIIFWSKNYAGGAYSQAITINLSTWGVTAAAAALNYGGAGIGRYNSCAKIDSNHFINFWQGLSSVGYAQIFEVNLSTWVVTTKATALQIATVAFGNSCFTTTDPTKVVNFWAGGGGFARVFDVNLTTYAVTTYSNLYKFSEISLSNIAIYPSASPYIAINIWSNTLTSPGPAQGGVFRFSNGVQENNYLYAQDGNYNIQKWNGATWTSVRTNLSQDSKARFAQYLNYIWMVNGNELVGNAIETSNGGVFGTTLVPEGFPPGDYIEAGFEGRIWVVDKFNGIIYYTDIVQFTPPSTYTLTYDPAVNFIKNISPQDGEVITALFRVPRALLVFTENHIFRIYGATSIDAYPAYNVGTYSQESIIESKTGIFFHHSSGFYQFDYGGQPVEISRRIIDFIQAIPSSNYENILGVYDGFDCVEWAIGTVTVEGVLFDNCVCRYTISTQVWTVYNYVNNQITAMITYDNGSTIRHLMGTTAGKTGAMDVGLDDFGVPFHFEMIDRWRPFDTMYGTTKSISGYNVYSENAAGVNLFYQVQGAQQNVWEHLDTIDENNNSILANANTKDFEVIRHRIAGTTNGTPIVIHGIELLAVENKGLASN